MGKMNDDDDLYPVFPWLKEQNADYICLQELKAQETDLSLEMKSPFEYKGYFSFAIKKGYSGVGIYTKYKPLKVTKHLGIPELDDEGRYIELEFRNLIITLMYLVVFTFFVVLMSFTSHLLLLILN